MTHMDWLRIAAAVIVIAAILAAGWSRYAIFHQVNQRVEPNRRVAFPWHTGQDMRAIRMYLALEPHGNLFRIYAGSIATIFVTVFATLIAQSRH